MEFLTPKQKKDKIRRLYFGYGLLSLLIILATYVLISTALGYHIFSTNGEVVQNGLLFVNSRPDGAEIYVNGKKESSNSNAKLSLPESLYDISLKKPGYRDWSTSVALQGGKVEFLNYPRLFPDQTEVLDSKGHGVMQQMLQSRNRRWIARYSQESPQSVLVSDLDNPTSAETTIVITDTILGGNPIVSLKLIEWAGDNEHLLAQVALADATKYVLLNRDKPTELEDLTAMFGLASSDQIGFWDGKWDKVYVLNASGNVYLGEVKDRKLATERLIPELVTKIFAFDKARAVYVVSSGEEQIIKLFSDSKTWTITSLKAGGQINVKNLGYNRNDYFLIGGENLEKTLVYRNFESAIKDDEDGNVAPFFNIPVKGLSVSPSRSNRLLMASDGKSVGVYDIEQKEFYKYQLAVQDPKAFDWFDDVRLYEVDDNGVLSIFDFNGQNRYEFSQKSVIGSPIVNNDVTRVLVGRFETPGYYYEVLDIE